MKDFNDRSRPKTAEDKNENAYKSACDLYEGQELILNAFRNRIFSIKLQEKRMGILTPKQILQRLPTALAQVKPGSISGNLINEIRQIINFSY